LIEQGIDGISLAPDAVLRSTVKLLEMERAFGSRRAGGRGRVGSKGGGPPRSAQRGASQV